MHELSIAELRQGLRNKKFSSVELTQHFLDRIAKFDGDLNSFITVTSEQALAQAKAADAALATGDAGLLAGIPLAQKDIFCTQGVKTSCGSKMLDSFIAPYNATVIDKFEQAGAVMLGKANMDEFAMGSSNETSFYGDCHNPWQLGTTPGGSSGGSASAVAARLAPGSTGTDTGGSIRQPASLCGITGIKPTYGRVSRWGMIAFCSSMDQGGAFAASAEDCALMLQAMSGHDSNDSTSVQQEVPDFSANLGDSLKGVKIGLPKEYWQSGLNSKIADELEKARQQMEQLGAEFVDISLPHTDLATSVYYIIAPAEASANLSRYDGVRYGYRCEDPKNLEDMYVRTRTEGFGDEVKRRIMVGTYVLSAGFYDAYFLKARKVRRLIKQDFVQAFEKVDAIFAPTAPSTAFALGSVTDPVAMYLNDLYTIPTNLAGLPGMSLPAGFVDGLPVGMQLIGNYFDESKILNIAHQYQQHTDWHTRMPEAYK